MKISSGIYKYRNIEVPKSVRPTTEKVREAIFSMVRDWIPDAVVLDLFAGSGAMGLEALSRGAARCYFNDINRSNYKILLSNIANCKADDLAVTSNRDFESCIAFIRETLDVIILDPPYERTEYYDKCFELLQENKLLNEGSIIIAEHLYNNELEDRYGNLIKIKEKKYGTIGVDLFIIDNNVN